MYETSVTVGAEGRITIPVAIRRKLKLNYGTTLSLRSGNNFVTLTPKLKVCACCGSHEYEDTIVTLHTVSLCSRCLKEFEAKEAMVDAD